MKLYRVAIITVLLMTVRGNSGLAQNAASSSKLDSDNKSLSTEVQTDVAVQSVVQKHRKLFNYYYKRAWRYNQKARGSIKIRLTIQDDGHVKKVEVLSDSVKIRSLTSFILKHAKQWEFDPDDTGGSVIDLIFPFAPV